MELEYVVPTPQSLDQLGPGCFVKVERGNKSFWVEIDDTDGYKFAGWVHPNYDAEDCPYVEMCHVSFNRNEISRLGCDHYCYC